MHTHISKQYSKKQYSKSLSIFLIVILFNLLTPHHAYADDRQGEQQEIHKQNVVNQETRKEICEPFEYTTHQRQPVRVVGLKCQQPQFIFELPYVITVECIKNTTYRGDVKLQTQIPILEISHEHNYCRIDLTFKHLLASS